MLKLKGDYMSVKLAYDTKKHRPLMCGDTQHHAGSLPVKDFDKYVRALYFKEYRTIYFRFFNPSGEYTYIDDKDIQRSFNVCDMALKAFIEEGLIPKGSKVLYWQTDKKVNENLIRY